MRTLLVSAIVVFSGLGFNGPVNANGINAVLDCSAGFQGGVICVASPSGQAHYAWTTTGALQVTPSCSTTSDVCHAECIGNGNGSISVTITSHSGQSDLDTENFFCIDGQADQ